MNKKQRRKKVAQIRQESKHKRQAKQEQKEDDILYGPGFAMKQEGRFLHTQATLTKEEHKEMLRDFANEAKDIEASILQQVAELQEIVKKCDPLTLIGVFSFRNTVIDPETYKEWADDGSAAFVEYLTLLCLAEPDPDGEEREFSVDGTVIQDIQNRVRGLFGRVRALWIAKDLYDNNATAPDTIRKLRLDTLGRSLQVRNMEYNHHLREILSGISKALSFDLRDVLGWNIEDALLAVDSIKHLMEERLTERRDKAQESEKDILKEVKLLRKNKLGDHKYPREFLEQLASLKPSESRLRAQDLLISWTFFDLGETLSFSVQDIVEQSGLESDVVSSLLGHMSLEFGAVDEMYRLPSPTNPLHTKPLIRRSNSYFVPLPTALLTAVRPLIETLINPESDGCVVSDNSFWVRYQKTRGAYLEQMAVNLLSKALKYAKSYTNLSFSYTKDGQEIQGELDGLLMFDNALFLVEAKAGTMTLPARRGASKRLLEELKKLVGEASEQTLKAKDYIETVGKTVFQSRDGTSVEVDSSKFERIFMVTVTLENLDAFVTMLYELEDLGLFKAEDLPWAVSLSDLMVIADIIDSPSEFIHYLIRRHRLNKHKRVYAFDELDWFGHYIEEGLYFDHMLNEGDNISVRLLSYTDIFDDYYYYVTGARKTPVAKPTQPMPDIMRRMLKDLEAARPQGFLDIACALLDLSGEARENFIKIAVKQRTAALSDGKMHDFSIPLPEANYGLTFYFGLSRDNRELMKRLPSHCTIKKYQSKSDLWIGLLCLADTPGWIDAAVIFKDKWEYDEVIDELASEYFTAPLRPIEELLK